jgi:glycosyltransferase involved in cell wall biosynthesis
MPRFLRAADVLVSPRDPAGNLPLKVLDYMTAGKPIVATDTVAHRSVLGNDTALLVEQTPDALARAIVKLRAAPAFASSLAKCARWFANERLGWKRFVDDINSMYESIAGTGGSKP